MPGPLFGYNLNALSVDLTEQIDCTNLLLQRLILLPVFCPCRGRIKFEAYKKISSSEK